MIRTLKEAAVRTYHYETFSQIRRHISDYLRWKTPHEKIRALWE